MFRQQSASGVRGKVENWLKWPKAGSLQRGGRARSLAELNRNPLARAIMGSVAHELGKGAGLIRGGVHAAQGLGDGAVFIRRLVDPMDQLVSPPGQSAIAQVARAASHGVQYARKAAANPQVVVRDVKSKAQKMRRDLDPAATPVAPTATGEFRRQLDIGMNQGELAFDVASMAVGGPLAKGVKGLGHLSKASGPSKYVAQGFGPEDAAYLAEPYPTRNLGHHFVPRSVGLPPTFTESVFNVLKPHGITRGDMYELHFLVDPRFRGTGGLPSGARWRGADLGLKKYGLPGRIWYGSPAPLKARVGGLGASAGSSLQASEDDEDAW